MKLYNFKGFANNMYTQATTNWAQIRSDQELLPSVQLKIIQLGCGHQSSSFTSEYVSASDLN